MKHVKSWKFALKSHLLFQIHCLGVWRLKWSNLCLCPYNYGKWRFSSVWGVNNVLTCQIILISWLKKKKNLATNRMFLKLFLAFSWQRINVGPKMPFRSSTQCCFLLTLWLTCSFILFFLRSWICNEWCWLSKWSKGLFMQIWCCVLQRVCRHARKR